MQRRPDVWSVLVPNTAVARGTMYWIHLRCYRRKIRACISRNVPCTHVVHEHGIHGTRACTRRVQPARSCPRVYLHVRVALSFACVGSMRACVYTVCHLASEQSPLGIRHPWFLKPWAVVPYPLPAPLCISLHPTHNLPPWAQRPSFLSRQPATFTAFTLTLPLSLSLSFSLFLLSLSLSFSLTLSVARPLPSSIYVSRSLEQPLLAASSVSPPLPPPQPPADPPCRLPALSPRPSAAPCSLWWVCRSSRLTVAPVPPASPSLASTLLLHKKPKSSVGATGGFSLRLLLPSSHRTSFLLRLRRSPPPSTAPLLPLPPLPFLSLFQAKSHHALYLGLIVLFSLGSLSCSFSLSPTVSFFLRPSIWVTLTLWRSFSLAACLSASWVVTLNLRQSMTRGVARSTRELVSSLYGRMFSVLYDGHEHRVLATLCDIGGKWTAWSCRETRGLCYCVTKRPIVNNNNVDGVGDGNNSDDAMLVIWLKRELNGNHVLRVQRSAVGSFVNFQRSRQK